MIERKVKHTSLNLIHSMNEFTASSKLVFAREQVEKVVDVEVNDGITKWQKPFGYGRFLGSARFLLSL